MAVCGKKVRKGLEEHMRLSTSTNIYFNRPNNVKAKIQDSVSLCAEAGYKVMDMNFFDCTTFKLPFVTDEWEKWIYDIKELSEKKTDRI